MQTSNTQASIKQPVQIALAQILFFIDAAIWVVFLILFVSDQAQPGEMVSSWVIPILMAGNALAMLACGIGLGKRSRFFYYLSLAVIGVNILLTVTDQVGLFDYITLLLDLVILTLLVASRKGFTPSKKPEDLSRPSPSTH
jgi:lysylphosphatidylglycerol synthetase-like protein (DUF2156 family)